MKIDWIAEALIPDPPSHETHKKDAIYGASWCVSRVVDALSFGGLSHWVFRLSHRTALSWTVLQTTVCCRQSQPTWAGATFSIHLPPSVAILTPRRTCGLLPQYLRGLYSLTTEIRSAPSNSWRT